MERNPEYKINDIFLKRWSPRAIAGKITKEELLTMLEAGRWAPSSYNNQPWRFIYGLFGTESFEKLSSLLFDGNSWAKSSGALVLVISKKTFDRNGKEYKTHSLEAGSAWQNVALQGIHMNIYTHGMGGFDYEKAREVFSIPKEYSVEMMFAVGKSSSKEDLSENLAEMETPNNRKPLKEIAFEGVFNHK